MPATEAEDARELEVDVKGSLNPQAYDGQWTTFNKIVASISDTNLIWTDGTKEAISKDITGKKFFMEWGGETLVAELRTDGELHWNDGDIWYRHKQVLSCESGNEEDVHPWLSNHILKSSATSSTAVSKGSLRPLKMTPKSPTQSSAFSLMEMSHEELNAHYENDWVVNMAREVRLSKIRKSLVRASSDPCIHGGASSTPVVVDRPPSNACVSAWKLWGKAGKSPIPDRGCWNDHFLTPTKVRKDPSGGPGSYCSNLMQRNVWTPKVSEFSQTGMRTKCTVSEFSASGRWQPHATRVYQLRLAGVSNADAFARTSQQMGDGVPGFALRFR